MQNKQRQREKNIAPGEMKVEKTGPVYSTKGHERAGKRRSTLAIIVADHKAEKEAKKKKLNNYMSQLRTERIEEEYDPKKRAEREKKNTRTFLKAKSALLDGDIGSVMDFEQDYKPSMSEMRKANQKKRIAAQYKKHKQNEK